MPSELAGVDAEQKQRLRLVLRARRRALDEALWRQRCAHLVERIEARIDGRAVLRVALFWPIAARREVDLRELDARLRRRGQRVAYPFWRADARGFAWTDDADELVASRHGFLEPHRYKQAVEPAELDWIVAPALAVDVSGYRLGYGAGYYDQLLPRFRPPARVLVAVFDDEVLPALPRERHDQPCDEIITELRSLVASPVL